MAKSSNGAIEKVLKFIKDKGIKFVDLKFMDFPGQWQHFTVPVTQFDEGSFEDGFGFDGSSIRGWKPIHESDMLLIPDPETMFVDLFIEAPTLSLICDVYEPATKQDHLKMVLDLMGHRFADGNQFMKAICFLFLIRKQCL